MASHLSPGRYAWAFTFLAALVVLIAMRVNRSYIPLFGPLSGILNGSLPIVKNAQNQVSYHGVTENGIDQFHNIFYAEDTSGQNRFAPPVPYLPEPGTVVDATTPGAWCPQATGGPPLPFTSPITNPEDCSNIWHTTISEVAGISVDTWWCAEPSPKTDISGTKDVQVEMR
ncbi:MAG: hypothetical protein Q9191_005743 [Dirinaria sp. TL-2023a]